MSAEARATTRFRVEQNHYGAHVVSFEHLKVDVHRRYEEAQRAADALNGSERALALAARIVADDAVVWQHLWAAGNAESKDGFGSSWDAAVELHGIVSRIGG